jgi:hypothetical protein
MTDIQTELEQLYAEADKLMEEIKSTTKPSLEIFEKVIKKLDSYPYKADVVFDVYEGNKRHHVFLYNIGGHVLRMDDHSWSCLDHHDQLVLIHALPTLVRKFIENVRHANFVDVGTIRFKKPWWRFRRRR